MILISEDHNYHNNLRVEIFPFAS